MKTATLKKLDILLLILSPIVASIVSLIFRTNLFVSVILFFGVPAFYLSLRTPGAFKKTVVYSLLFSIPYTLLVDYLFTTSHVWHVPTIFSFRIAGKIPIEDLLFGFSFVYLIIIYYEHFLDKGRHNLKISDIKYVILFATAISILFAVELVINPEKLIIPYIYFIAGFIAIIIPIITFLNFFPKMISKFLKTAAYFFALTIIFELTALELNQWFFPSPNFIGWVKILNYRFPFEEFFFWLVLSTIGILSYYEFLADDRK